MKCKICDEEFQQWEEKQTICTTCLIVADLIGNFGEEDGEWREYK